VPVRDKPDSLLWLVVAWGKDAIATEQCTNFTCRMDLCSRSVVTGSAVLDKASSHDIAKPVHGRPFLNAVDNLYGKD
jgi:hypothetical protein